MGRFLFLFVFLFKSLLFSSEFIYLTYPGDPARSMAIHWLEMSPEKGKLVEYRRIGKEEWIQGKGTFSEFGEFFLVRAVLNELEPDTEYEFRVEGEESLHRFRTLPASLDRPLRIAIGGDAYKKLSPYKKMNLQVAKLSPDFVILGGDIAYANKGNEVIRWKTFFEEWQKTMSTQEGRMIPLVAAVGNHDLSSGFFTSLNKKNVGEFFLDLFPYLEKSSYGMLTVTEALTFFLLDTGHIAPIQGDQVQWLREALKKKEATYKVAVYHVGAYPSVYSYKGKIPTLIRSSWCPLFEEFGVIAAFENHNHAFKRTYPIKKEKVDPTGVVYMGDGCWSMPPRKSWGKRWYLDSSKAVSCFSLLTLSKEGIDIQSIDNKGKVFDQWMPKR